MPGPPSSDTRLWTVRRTVRPGVGRGPRDQAEAAFDAEPDELPAPDEDDPDELPPPDEDEPLAEEDSLLDEDDPPAELFDDDPARESVR